MKKYVRLLLPVLLCLGTLLFAGCISAGYNSSSVSTPEGKALNKGVYLDFFGHGRQVYPEPVAQAVPVYYQERAEVSYAESYPVYGGPVVYSGGYYGRPTQPADYGRYRGHDYQPHHPQYPHELDHGRRYDPPTIYVHPPRTYVQPPYILPPSGSTTVVTPTYGTPTLPSYTPPQGTTTVVRPNYVPPPLPSYRPPWHY